MPHPRPRTPARPAHSRPARARRRPGPAGPAAAARLAALAACAAALAGCGVPPELLEPSPSASPRPAPATPTPTTVPDLSLPPLPAPTLTRTPAFAEATAVDCQGQPTGTQVISVLRRARLLPTDVTVTVRVGPLCAGDWQYTELRVPRREPLLVVTQGAPTALTLVAAGTNVCGARVRAIAPAGIRAAACDTAPTPTIGAGPSTPASGT